MTTYKNFKDFTNLYPINKTLRFSLVPQGETAKFLDIENNTKENFEKDREIQKAYQDIKIIIDELHSEFIDEAMNNFSLEISALKELEKEILETVEFNKNRQDGQKKKIISEKNLKKLEKKIASQFSAFVSEKYKFQEKDKNGNLKIDKKGKKKEILFTQKNILGQEVLKLLEVKYKNNSEKEEIIKKFQGFFTALTGYCDNRGNYYKGENKAGQFATRTINENLIQFLKNKHIFENKYKDIHKKIGFQNIELFELSYSNNLFLQAGLDKYNEILGGANEADKIKIQGINEKINLYRQNQESKNKKNFRSSDFPFFKELYKQIGSLKAEQDFNFIKINSDAELLEKLGDFPKYSRSYLAEINNFYKNFFENIEKEEIDLSKIYLSKRAGSILSHLIFSDWQKMDGFYRKGTKDDAGNDKKENYLSLFEIKEKINNLENLEFKLIYRSKFKIDNSDKNYFANFLKAWRSEVEKIFTGGEKEIFDEKDGIKNESVLSISELEKRYFAKIKEYKNKILEKKAMTDKEEQEFKENIKNYLDRILEIDRLIKNFDLGKQYFALSIEDKDPLFYKAFDEMQDKSREVKISKYYDEFRNYLTKRNVNEEKFRLNFDESTFMGGWDLNKENNKNYSVIFRDKDKYFLGIINTKKDKNILDKASHPQIFVSASDFYKMEYKNLGDVKRQLPRMAFSNIAKQNGENLGWTSEIQKIKDEYTEFQTSKKDDKEKWGDEFDRKKLTALIDYYKNVLTSHSENYKETYSLKWKKSAEYKNLGEFNDDIQRQVYKVSFIPIDKNYVQEKVKNGDLYLFQIYNKDFSEHKLKTSAENLHTIYFKELFSEENLKNPIFSLNAGEMFFRDKTEEHKINKWKKEDLKNPKTNKLPNKKRRYAENKILLHLSVGINFDKGNSGQKINKEINNYISKNSEKINIIGVDRGEKHLLYYSLINNAGKLLKIETLNVMNGVDYQKKLDDLEKDRQTARKSWQAINKIKEMKKGYLSLVIKKIVDLALENNAIIVLEDLNFGFKTGRQKIEKNVYQQFEKALIDKLNFAVDKKTQNQRFAPQLSAPFESFQKIGKQTGIIYYVPAANTSKVCPKCNWRRNIFVHYSNVKDMPEKFGKYKLKIFYEKEKKRFRFEYENEGEKGKIYSDVDRLYWDRKLNCNKGGIIEFMEKFDVKDGIQNEAYQQGSLTKNLKELFTRFNERKTETDWKFNGFDIEIDTSDLFQKIKTKNEKNNATEWKRFVYLFNRMLDIRNSVNKIGKREEDNIICPACHFDSRKSKWISDGDANGAFNIARRGLFLVKRIKDNPELPKLFFKNNDYFQFIKNIKQ